MRSTIEGLDDFLWDPEKAAENIPKHGVSFEEGVTVFDDPLALTVPDHEHSSDEDRWWTIGHSTHGRLLIVYHTYRGVDAIRLIGVRPADPSERRDYGSG